MADGGRLGLGPVDQVSYVVADLERSLPRYEALYGPFEVGETPLNITADATKGVCTGGLDPCELTFTNTSGAKPWNPWDVAGPGQSWPPDGVVDLPNDILSVILHFCPNGPCVKP